MSCDKLEAFYNSHCWCQFLVEGICEIAIIFVLNQQSFWTSYIHLPVILFRLIAVSQWCVMRMIRVSDFWGTWQCCTESNFYQQGHATPILVRCLFSNHLFFNFPFDKRSLTYIYRYIFVTAQWLRWPDEALGDKIQHLCIYNGWTRGQGLVGHGQ